MEPMGPLPISSLLLNYSRGLSPPVLVVGCTLPYIDFMSSCPRGQYEQALTSFTVQVTSLWVSDSKLLLSVSISFLVATPWLLDCNFSYSIPFGYTTLSSPVLWVYAIRLSAALLRSPPGNSLLPPLGALVLLLIALPRLLVVLCCRLRTSNWNDPIHVQVMANYK